jgi:hypothetical protein
MPVKKFRSFEEAREALWGEPGDPGYYRRLAWLWAFSERLYPLRFPKGVHRFASIEDANLQRQIWEMGGERRRHARRPSPEG